MANAEQMLTEAEANKPDAHLTTEAREEAHPQGGRGFSHEPDVPGCRRLGKKSPRSTNSPARSLNTSSTGLSSRSQQPWRSPPPWWPPIASMPERGQSNGKLARAIRAMPLPPSCKTLRRISGIVRTEFKDRTKVAYVPVDVATGKVLDPAFQPAPSPQPPTSKIVRLTLTISNSRQKE